MSNTILIISYLGMIFAAVLLAETALVFVAYCLLELHDWLKERVK